MSKARLVKKIIRTLGEEFCEECVRDKNKCLRIKGVADENIVYSTNFDNWFYLQDYKEGKVPVPYEHDYVEDPNRIRFKFNGGAILNPETGKWIDEIGANLSTRDQQKYLDLLEDNIYESYPELRKYKDGRFISEAIALRITDPEYRRSGK